jgi:hypothetical protein
MVTLTEICSARYTAYEPISEKWCVKTEERLCTGNKTVVTHIRPSSGATAQIGH